MAGTRSVGITVLSDRGDERGRVIEVEKGVLARNEATAAANRATFAAHGLLVLNLVSSPGSGKTTFLGALLQARRDLPAAVIVGDLATDRDGERLRASGAEVVQITTGGVCHLEAAMIAGAADRLELTGKRLLVIENVGNLVCPAAFDLGEGLRIVMLSVTEGEDKPLKYPRIFKTADAVIVSKMDLADAVGLDEPALRANLAASCPQARVFAVSARTGDGMASFHAYLDAQLEAHPAAAR